FVDRDVTVHILVEHTKGDLGLLLSLKNGLQVLEVDEFAPFLDDASVDESSECMSRGGVLEQLVHDPTRVVAVNLATNQVIADSTSDVADLVQGMPGIVLERLHGSLSATS